MEADVGIRPFFLFRFPSSWLSMRMRDAVVAARGDGVCDEMPAGKEKYCLSGNPLPYLFFTSCTSLQACMHLGTKSLPSRNQNDK